MLENDETFQNHTKDLILKLCFLLVFFFNFYFIPETRSFIIAKNRLFHSVANVCVIACFLSLF